MSHRSLLHTIFPNRLLGCAELNFLFICFNDIFHRQFISGGFKIKIFIKYILPILQIIILILSCKYFSYLSKENILEPSNAYKYNWIICWILYIFSFMLVFKLIKKIFYIFLIIQFIIFFIYLVLFGLDEPLNYMIIV